MFIDRENTASTVLVPRLEATQADLSRCKRIPMIRTTDKEGNILLDEVDLKKDIGTLEDAITHIGNVALVIIDPITDYLGATDANSNAEVRTVLGKLNTLAERRGVAIIGINHTNKNTHMEARSRAMGSGAFVSASRASFVVSEDKENPGRHLFMPEKNNLGAKGKGYAFTVEAVTVSNNIRSTCCAWEGELHDTTADEALAPKEPGVKGRPPAQLEQAMNLINSALKDGPVEQSEMSRRAEDAGISWRTMERAKKALCVTSVPGDKGWAWTPAVF